MRKLICFPHGIGDVIMSTPGLSIFKKKYNVELGFAYNRRIANDKLTLPCIDEHWPISDAWMDFDDDFEFGLKCVVNESKAIAKTHGYDEVIVITLQYGNLNRHRIIRIADELGVKDELLVQKDWFGTELDIDKVNKNIFPEIDFEHDLVICLHYRGGNVPKVWDIKEVQKFADFMVQTYGAKIIVFETHTGYKFNDEFKNKINGENIYSTANIEDFNLIDVASVIDSSKLFIGIDSGPSWIAHCTKTPMITLFTMTRMHETAPLRNGSYIIASKKAKTICEPEWFEKNEHRITIAEAFGEDIDASTVEKFVVNTLKLMQINENIL